MKQNILSHRSESKESPTTQFGESREPMRALRSLVARSSASPLYTKPLLILLSSIFSQVRV